MTRIILKQRARGDHGFIREVWVVGEGLKERLELEMGSESICWPLRSELLQFVSDGFGGHRESCAGSDIGGVSNRCRNGDPSRFV